MTAMTRTPQGVLTNLMKAPRNGLHQPAFPIRASSLITVLSLLFTRWR